MTQDEETRILGEAVASRRTKRETLKCLTTKITSMAADISAVAEILLSKGFTLPSYERQQIGFQQHTSQAWKAKLRDDNFQGDSMKWPTWEELSRTFRQIETIQAEIQRLDDLID